METTMFPSNARPRTVANRWIAGAIAGFHRFLCHPIVEIAQHAIPHPELHLAFWAVALLCRVAGHGRRWAKPIEHIARMLGGDE
jgi:hypothetical protein